MPDTNHYHVERLMVRTVKFLFFVPSGIVVLCLRSQGAFLSSIAAGTLVELIGLVLVMKARSALKHRSPADSCTPESCGPESSAGSVLEAVVGEQAALESVRFQAGPRQVLSHFLRSLGAKTSYEVAYFYANEEVAGKINAVAVCCMGIAFKYATPAADEGAPDSLLAMSHGELALRCAVILVAEMVEDVCKKRVLLSVGRIHVASIDLEVSRSDILESMTAIWATVPILLIGYKVAPLLA